jgi:hypothetical protein
MAKDGKLERLIERTGRNFEVATDICPQVLQGRR